MGQSLSLGEATERGWCVSSTGWGPAPSTPGLSTDVGAGGLAPAGLWAHPQRLQPSKAPGLDPSSATTAGRPQILFYVNQQELVQRGLFSCYPRTEQLRNPYIHSFGSYVNSAPPGMCSVTKHVGNHRRPRSEQTPGQKWNPPQEYNHWHLPEPSGARFDLPCLKGRSQISDPL